MKGIKNNPTIMNTYRFVRNVVGVLAIILLILAPNNKFDDTVVILDKEEPRIDNTIHTIYGHELQANYDMRYHKINNVK